MLFRRKKHLYGPMAEEIIRKAKNKVRTGQHAAMIRALHSEVKQNKKKRF